MGVLQGLQVAGGAALEGLQGGQHWRHCRDCGGAGRAASEATCRRLRVRLSVPLAALVSRGAGGGGGGGGEGGPLCCDRRGWCVELASSPRRFPAPPAIPAIPPLCDALWRNGEGGGETLLWLMICGNPSVQSGGVESGAAAACLLVLSLRAYGAPLPLPSLPSPHAPQETLPPGTQLLGCQYLYFGITAT